MEPATPDAAAESEHTLDYGAEASQARDSHAFLQPLDSEDALAGKQRLSLRPGKENMATPIPSPAHGSEREKEESDISRDDSFTVTKSKSESGLYNGNETSTPSVKLTKKESLKVQKQNYKQEKKRATKELLSNLKDPTVVIMADWLKIRGTLKSWTKLWCVLKPGVLLIYKSPKNEHWVGTVMLNVCQLIERPSKKDGFCFKLFHPLDQSIWAVKGPEGETVGAITQPLPGSYLIFRAISESDGRCWMDALELALRCSSLLKRAVVKDGKEAELNNSVDGGHMGLLQLLRASAPFSPQENLNESEIESAHFGSHHLPWEGSGRSNGGDGDGQREESDEDGTADKTDDSDSDVSDRPDAALVTATPSNGSPANGSPGNGSLGNSSQSNGSPPEPVVETSYVAELGEEFGEVGEAAQTETVSEENKGLIWTLLKQLRPGMDLSKVVLPTFILEPRSFLDKLSDYYYHADILSQAAVEENAYDRIKQVVRWYLSGFYKKPKGLKKPYNPIIGETFRCMWIHPQTSSKTYYISEQVSHHPPISAFFISNRKDGFCISGNILARSKFYGNSLSAILDGEGKLTFLNRGEEYLMTMPYAHCKGILYGTMTLELGGKIIIDCEKTNYKAEIEFKLKPFLGSSDSVNQVSGKIKLGKEVLATLQGHWDREVLIHELSSGVTEVFWHPTSDVRHQRLQRHTVAMHEQGEFESERLWQHVTRAIQDRDQNRATQEKFVLEEAQRNAAKERKESNSEWTPKLFRQDPITGAWCYKYADTRPWDMLNDMVQFERDGAIQTHMRHRAAHSVVSLAVPSGSHKGFRTVGPDLKPLKGGLRHRKNPLPDHQHLDSSDNDDVRSHGSRSRRRHGLVEIHEAIDSVRKTQEEINKNLAFLARRVLPNHAAEEESLLQARDWMLIFLLLLSQLLITYILK